MPKISKEQIRKDERKVLVELTKNAKENIDTIAKRCKFSSQKVRRVITHLEENNTLWGYTAVFEEKKIGMEHFVMMAKRSGKKIDEQTVNQIISRRLEDHAGGLGVTIESSFYVHGEYDWIITFTAKDILTAKKFVYSLSVLNPDIIGKITVMQTLMFIRKQYILNPGRKKLKEFL